MILWWGKNRHLSSGRKQMHVFFIAVHIFYILFVEPHLLDKSFTHLESERCSHYFIQKGSSIIQLDQKYVWTVIFKVFPLNLNWI